MGLTPSHPVPISLHCALPRPVQTVDVCLLLQITAEQGPPIDTNTQAIRRASMKRPSTSLPGEPRRRHPKSYPRSSPSNGVTASFYDTQRKGAPQLPPPLEPPRCAARQAADAPPEPIPSDAHAHQPTQKRTARRTGLIPTGNTRSRALTAETRRAASGGHGGVSPARRPRPREVGRRKTGRGSCSRGPEEARGSEDKEERRRLETGRQTRVPVVCLRHPQHGLSSLIGKKKSCYTYNRDWPVLLLSGRICNHIWPIISLPTLNASPAQVRNRLRLSPSSPSPVV